MSHPRYLTVHVDDIGLTLLRPVAEATGLVDVVRDSIKHATEEEKKKEEEALLQQKIESLVSEIEDLELSLPDVSDIALTNVMVTSRQYGVGTITEHELNKITVQFNDVTKTFILDKKHPMRPTFENDSEVVEVYSEYGELSLKIDALKRQLQKLTN